jgi:starch synthase
MGAGEQRFHQETQELAKRYPDRVSAHLTFNDELARTIYAGSDMLLMPSRFEPCGTSQMIAMRYGCVPIVHRTGGLADTVTEFDAATGEGNGFSFEEQNAFHFLAAIVRGLEMYKRPEQWRTLMQSAMSADHSWDASAEQYVALYRRAQELQRLTTGRSAGRRARAR